MSTRPRRKTAQYGGKTITPNRSESREQSPTAEEQDNAVGDIPEETQDGGGGVPGGQAIGRSVEGSSLTSVPTGTDEDNQEKSSTSPRMGNEDIFPDGQPESAEPGGDTFIDELAQIVDNAHNRYETVQNDITDCLDLQKEITLRFEGIQNAARKEKDRLRRVVHKLKEKYNENGDNVGRLASPQSPATQDAERRYADLNDPLERAKSALFRGRDQDETSTLYRERQNAQNRFLAREHYEDGVRERNRRAERYWNERVAQNSGGGVGFQFGNINPDSGSSSSSDSED